jgi:hypothetical protein
MNLPSDMQAKRAIEDRAATLGVERRDIEANLAANSQAIIDLLCEMERSGVRVPYEHLASLTYVSRQTLYRWREVLTQPGGERHGRRDG